MRARSFAVRAAVAGAAVLSMLPTSAHSITGGRIATRDYPHMAVLEYKGDFICGASLVAPQWVLTAAHCMLDAKPGSFTFILGRKNLNDAGGEVIGATLLNIHESYGKPNPDSHDVSLLKLERASSYAPIALADPAADGQYWEPGDVATVIGYGGQAYPGLVIDGNLREVEVPVVDDEECSLAYTATGDFESNTMVCAGERQGVKDSCQGDSGGPLMVPDADGAFIQMGVVSWGFGCGFPTQYGVYSRVGDSALGDWIAARIGASAPAPATIKGKITDAKTKSALGGATVSCPGAGSATSASNGSYTLGNVPVATYVCTASKSGYASKDATLTVTPGGTLTQDFALRKR